MKKTLCVFISCLMLVATMTGCGGNSFTTDTVKESNDSSVTTTDTSASETSETTETSANSEESSSNGDTQTEAEYAKKLINSYELPDVYYMSAVMENVDFNVSKDKDDFCVNFAFTMDDKSSTINYFCIGDKLYFTTSGLDEKDIKYVANASDLTEEEKAHSANISFDEVQSLKLEYVDELGNNQYKVKCTMKSDDEDDSSDGTVTLKNGKIASISFVNTANENEECTIIPEESRMPEPPKDAEQVSGEDLMTNFALSMMAVMFSGMENIDDSNTDVEVDLSTAKNYPDLKVQGYATFGSTTIFVNFDNNTTLNGNDETVYFAHSADGKQVVEWYEAKDNKDLYIDADIIEADDKYYVGRLNGYSYK